MFDQVLQEVEAQCREERIPMLGPEKAKFLAACVEKAKPSLLLNVARLSVIPDSGCYAC